MTGMRTAPALAAALLVAAPPVLAQDLDRDGLSDRLEQALLERFLPTFVLSAGECDERPATFIRGSADPKVLDRDGRIYGHAAPRTGAAGQAEVELKFFHLWARDCGRPSHTLDVEHVSALVAAPASDAPAGEWRARYWYAAAHEQTICDASSGGSAAALRAETTGPYVYVSRGKHASYLDRGHCKWGCGSDICDPGPVLPRAGVTNMGEAEAPLNGARWVGSRRWDLASKLASDFGPDRRTALDAHDPDRVAVMRLRLRAWQAPILGGDTGLDALVAAGEAGLAAAEAAEAAAGTAAGAAGNATVTAVKSAGRGVAGALRRAGGSLSRLVKGR